MNTIAYATTTDNPLGADEGISVLSLGSELALISGDITTAQSPDLVLDADAADALLREAGWQRSGDWIYSGGQYAAEVEPVA